MLLSHVFMYLSYFFFFSSRRRHTRLQGDWSSDVCSSDLSRRLLGSSRSKIEAHQWLGMYGPAPSHKFIRTELICVDRVPSLIKHARTDLQIGRASCRERVEISVVAVSLKKKKVTIEKRLY